MNTRQLGKSALAVGSTSTLALLASANHVLADGLYIGFSAGTVTGDHPGPGDSDEDYQLEGAVSSVHVGIDKQITDSVFAGVEVAWTGPFEGDADELSSYEYAYDINYNVDAKLRVGTTLSGVKVYGFGGVSVGELDGCCYGNDYRYQGINIGAGAEMEIFPDVLIGAEVINRQTTGTFDSEDGYTSNHTAASLRVGFRF